jgi:hypothetical protein
VSHPGCPGKAVERVADGAATGDVLGDIFCWLS